MLRRRPWGLRGARPRLAAVTLRFPPLPSLASLCRFSAPVGLQPPSLPFGGRPAIRCREGPSSEDPSLHLQGPRLQTRSQSPTPGRARPPRVSARRAPARGFASHCRCRCGGRPRRPRTARCFWRGGGQQRNLRNCSRFASRTHTNFNNQVEGLHVAVRPERGARSCHDSFTGHVP